MNNALKQKFQEIYDILNVDENNKDSVIDISNFPTMEELERQYFFIVMKKVDNNKSEAAKILGLTIKSIYNKLDRYFNDNFKQESLEEIDNG